MTSFLRKNLFGLEYVDFPSVLIRIWKLFYSVRCENSRNNISNCKCSILYKTFISHFKKISKYPKTLEKYIF